ncbi:hypothetical protein JIG36_48675 [Actinoplanes sp. LDG1-06]|uniref:Uncharacterized protein n=1 Tax=Paractinoplanes ovalisporus TaxID=2810368 RepID=A0ABS2AU63_9ACTN|nr:hypothetical protein [Actinoplanes ovalisporus]
MTDHQPIDDELLRMVGNAQEARAVKENLQRLRDGAGGPAFAEMAKDLLEGRTTLREIGNSAAYGPQLSAAFRRFQQWRSELTPEERAKLERKAQEQLEDPGTA